MAMSEGTFFQRNISPMVTRFYARLGYLDRGDLAQGLSQITPVSDATIIIRNLQLKDILKKNINIDSLQQVRPYMIKAVSPAKIDSMIGAIFPNSEDAVKNIAGGMAAGLSTVSVDALASGGADPVTPFNRALIGGLGVAAVVGGVVSGLASVPVVPLLFTGGTIYGVISTIMYNNVKDPQSPLGKIFSVGKRILPIAIMGYMTTALCATAASGGMFSDFINQHLQDALLWGMIGCGAGYTAWTCSDISRATRTNMASFYPHKNSKYFANDLMLANGKMFSTGIYLGYRFILYGSYISMTLAHLSGFSLALLGAGVAARIFLPWLSKHAKFTPERASSAIGKFFEKCNSRTISLSSGEITISGKRDSYGGLSITINNGVKAKSYSGPDYENISRQIRFNDEAFYDEIVPLAADVQKFRETLKQACTSARLWDWSELDDLGFEYFYRLVLKWGPLLALTLPFSSSPVGLFCDLATIYFGSWSLYQDMHGGINSFGMAWDFKRSLFNLGGPYPSDAERNKMDKWIARINAYVNEVERNINGPINMLIRDYDHMQDQRCSEQDTYGGLDSIRALFVAEQILQMVLEWQKEIYDRFLSAYRVVPLKKNSSQDEIEDSARELVKVLNEMGESLYPEETNNDPHSYFRQLEERLKKNKKDLEDHPDKVMDDGTVLHYPDLMFYLEEDKPFLRDALKAVNFRGHAFMEMARDIQRMIDTHDINYEYLDGIYRKMLGIYSVTINHFLRKFDYMDELYKDKTSNVSTVMSHRGDTLYQVWTMDSIAGQRLFKGFHVPTTLVRVNNPDYNYRKDSGDEKKDKRYIWVSRRDYLHIIATSSSMSDDFQLVKLKPPSDSKKENKILLPAMGGHPPKEVRGYYSNKEKLEPEGLLDWNGDLVDRKGKLIWIAGEDKASYDFMAAFKEWARAKFKSSKYDGITYDDWSAKNKAIWYINEPQVFAFAPWENYNISDENYIVLNSERELQTEVEHTKERDKLLRVASKEGEWEAEFRNPGYNINEKWNRPYDEVETWGKEDVLVAFTYTIKDGDKDGEEIDIPYGEERDIVDGMAKGDWVNISYALIKKDGNGNPYLEVYSKDDRKMGVIKRPWPIHMHPCDEIVGGRVKIEMFADPYRVGKATYLWADWGESYIDKEVRDKNRGNLQKTLQLYKRRRYIRLDPDTEAKQEFRPNFCTSIKDKDGGKKVVFGGFSLRRKTYPIEKWCSKFFDIPREIDGKTEVLEADGSGDAFVDPDNDTWAPRQKNEHSIKVTGGLLFIGDKQNSAVKKVAEIKIEDLPFSLRSPKEARKVISVEKSEKDGETYLDFIKLLGDSIKDDSRYVYALSQTTYNSYYPNVRNDNHFYEQLKWMLDKKDITAGFEKDHHGNIYIYLYDENGNKIPDIKLSGRWLKDNKGRRLLHNKEMGMDSLDSFYHSSDNIYDGTREFRPHFMKTEGEIKLILTRVAKKIRIKASPKIAAILADTAKPDMFFARPTSAARIKTPNGAVNWVPLSLTKPVTYTRVPNVAQVEVERGDGQTSYFKIPLSKDLPELTCYIRHGKGEDGFFSPQIDIPEDDFKVPFIIKDEKKMTPEEHESRKVKDAVAEQIIAELKKNGISDYKNENIKIYVFHVPETDIIEGVYQHVVHGQDQLGPFHKDEEFPAAEAAHSRDIIFYGTRRQPFAEAIPYDGEDLTPSQQSGRDTDRDENGVPRYAGVENGTQYVGSHLHIFEMMEATLGLPKGIMLALAPYLEKRSGGYEKASHKPRYKKLVAYCRELGWLSGVSEDYEGALAAAEELGYALKYFMKITAFEYQPTRWDQTNKQDYYRYATAMALLRDVMWKRDAREIMDWFAGREMKDTFKQKFENFLSSIWYDWPKAEMSRQFAPAIFMLSNGNIKPYIVDPFFMFAYFLDFGVGLALYTRFRKEVGSNMEYTKNDALTWAFIKGPAMNISFLFSALNSNRKLFREGWQYGAFTTTAQQKSGKVPQENKDLLKLIMLAQTLSLIWGLWGTIPVNLLFGTSGDAFAEGYFLNEFWTLYGLYINKQGLKWIKENQEMDPTKKPEKAGEKTPFAKKQEASEEISEISRRDYRDSFRKAYDLARSGNIKNIDAAKRVFERLVGDQHMNKDMTTALYAEKELPKFGMGKDTIASHSKRIPLLITYEKKLGAKVEEILKEVAKEMKDASQKNDRKEGL